MPGLSAVLIVRDEERHVAECLARVRPVVDEIVVVDTGSRDRTPEIVRDAGARLYFEPWRDDFASARNAALDRASGDWVLYIDADERLELHGDLRDALGARGAVAATVAFHARSDLTPYPEPRLFRRRSDIRFRGVIHETIRYDVDAAVERGERVVAAPATIRHLGYEGDRRAKHARDLPLLERAVADCPRRVYLWHALGEAQLGLSRPEDAVRSWRQGLAVARGVRPRATHVVIFADLLGAHFDAGPVELEDHEELVEQCLRDHPDDPLALWFQARHLAASGRGSRAREVLERLQRMEPDDAQGAPVGYDRRLFTSHAWALMGSCWLADGEPARALEWLERAEAARPDDLEVRTKRALAEARLRRAGGSRPEGG